MPYCTVTLQATRNVLRISEQVNDMLADWRELNFVEISKMSVFVAQQDSNPDHDLIREGTPVIMFSFTPLSLCPSCSCLGDGAAICKAVTTGGLL